MEENILKTIGCISDIKKLNIDELKQLSHELRNIIIDVAYKNGGHLAPSLGAVDCITALCHTYDFENDKLIFDVGHQSYAYKILLRGKENFKTLRMSGGESGYPDGKKGDNFIGGHAGNSISASLGIANARDQLKEDYSVVTFVGDASFFNGENLEALFSNEEKPKNFVIIFNDNGMSISENENGMYKFFSKMALKKGYRRTKSFFKKIFGKGFLGKHLKRVKSSFKRWLSPGATLDVVGLKYYGVFDGHDIKTLCSVFEEVKERGISAFIHIKTTKGKGYEPAEKSAEKFHGVSKNFESSCNTFSGSISQILIDECKKNDKIVAITAGMKCGTGLSEFEKNFPQRFYDVGISEEFAVTFAGGLASAGLKPVVCIYSTFLQRAYDQIISDICMQKLPVIFMLDRSGVVGADGRTHQGVFDLSYLRSIPGLILLAPKDSSELKAMFSVALTKNCPVAIRYPNGDNQPIASLLPFSDGLEWEVLKKGNSICILAVGPRMVRLALNASQLYGENVEVVNARTINPMDEKLLFEVKNKKIITMEENMLSGGFGEGVCSFYQKNNITCKIKNMAIDNKFVEHGSISYQLEICSLDEKELKKNIDYFLKIDNQ